MAGKMSINFKTNLMEISEIKKLLYNCLVCNELTLRVLKYNLFGLMLEEWEWNLCHDCDLNEKKNAFGN